MSSWKSPGDQQRWVVERTPSHEFPVSWQGTALATDSFSLLTITSVIERPGKENFRVVPRLLVEPGAPGSTALDQPTLCGQITL